MTVGQQLSGPYVANKNCCVVSNLQSSERKTYRDVPGSSELPARPQL